MSVLYVPVVVPPQAPSRRAKELAELLEGVIRDFERTHSSVTAQEIRVALMLAQQQNTGVGPRRMVAVGLALALALGVAVLNIAGKTGGLGAAEIPWSEVSLVLVVVLAAVAAVVGITRRQP